MNIHIKISCYVFSNMRNETLKSAETANAQIYLLLFLSFSEVSVMLFAKYF